MVSPLTNPEYAPDVDSVSKLYRQVENHFDRICTATETGLLLS